MKLKNLHGNIHYGWYIVLAGMFCVFACLGLGRFALGMVLPSMGQGLGLSYSQMGLVSTANFVGYLVAVLLCGFLLKHISYRFLISLALLIVAATMIAIGNSSSFTLILVLYTLCGVGSGVANVPMVGLISIWFAPGKRGKAAGFMVIGSGFAILLSGRLIPYINELVGVELGWRLSWQVLGVICLIVALFCLAILRNSPAEKGLKAYGADEKAQPQYHPLAAGAGRMTVLHLGAIYFLFGYSYVIYITFIVTTMVNEHGFSEATAGYFWAAIGLLSLFSGPVFGHLSDRLGRSRVLAFVFAVQAFAYLLVALALPPVFLFISVACFGLVAWSIPSIMAALAGDYAGPQGAARIFGTITFILATGQIAGPVVAGALAEGSGSLASSFLMISLSAVIGVVLSLKLKPPELMKDVNIR